MDHDCVLAILRGRGHVLMCHRHPTRDWVPNVWDFPGGHIEPCETPQRALARELREELGVEIEAPPTPPDAVLEFPHESLRLAVWIINYDGPVENRCPDEHDEIRWMTLEEAAAVDVADPGYLPLIEQALLD